MVRGGRREEGSGWGTRVYLWQIHIDIWQNQYNIVKLKNKIKKYKKSLKKQENFRKKPSTSALLTMQKPLTIWSQKTVENS